MYLIWFLNNLGLSDCVYKSQNMAKNGRKVGIGERILVNLEIHKVPGLN